MSRRADPDRLHLARRFGVRNRLTDDKSMALETAEAWCDAWEAEAARRGLDRDSADFWHHGTNWIFDELRTRRLPE